ncbi:MAG: serine/threonine protein kinase, partial [Myxococcaceae bacterium]|nr:serine/threonine protein kinase [Myxococcaceae bacterium]
MSNSNPRAGDQAGNAPPLEGQSSAGGRPSSEPDIGLSNTVHSGEREAPGDPPELGLETTHHSGEHPGPEQPHGPGLARGATIDRYVVLAPLGAGGMGEVYAAWDPMLDRKVAIKLLKAEHQGTSYADDLRHRLLREARALARLSHPNVVTVHDVGVIDDQIYLAMEFVEGQTLTSWLSEKPRSWREVLELFLQAGEGLAAAHAAGVTHRDFKPDNVVVSRQGRARVMDFGLAFEHGREREQPPVPVTVPPGSLQRRITQPGTMLGTPAYMAPEALFGKPTDPRSDEFSFAVALYEALYGVRPFEGDTVPAVIVEMQLNRVRPPPRATRVPRRIHLLLLKALRVEPGERFQSLRALLIHLGRRSTSRRRGLITASLVALTVTSVAIVAAMARREAQRCAGVSARLSGIWDDGARGDARRAFLATGRPWAASAFSATESLMDVWGRRWVDRRRAVCEASFGQADEQVGATIVCLGRKLADFDATARLLRSADPDVVERAVSLAAALPDLEGCDPRAASMTPAPNEVGTSREALAKAKALLEAGKLKEAHAAADQALAGALAADEGGALAEATLLSARLAAAEL